jgi:hypothetical protein
MKAKNGVVMFDLNFNKLKLDNQTSLRNQNSVAFPLLSVA